jgi:tetratricopeptide (TPR) repeat protein/AraC-like DNA-binding protein
MVSKNLSRIHKLHSFQLVSRIAWSLLFFLFFAVSFVWAQEKSTPLDEKLEAYLKSNAIQEAKSYLSEKTKSLADLSAEEQVYYLNRSSQVSLMEGAFDDALNQAKKSSFLLKAQPESKLWGETYRALCFAYIRTAKLDSALIFAEKLYEFTKINEDLGMRRGALMALGNISLQNKSYQKSLEFYTEALETTKSLGDSVNLKVDYYNIGLALSQLNEYAKSEENLLKAADLAQKDQAWDLLATTYGTLADNYLDQKKYNLQIEYLKKANEIAEKIGNKQLLAMGYANLSETSLLSKNYNEAIKWGDQSLALLKERPILQLEAKVDSMLYAAHKNLGNYGAALEKLERYDQLRLQIRNQTQLEKLSQLTIQFETEKKDLLIQNQNISLKEEKAKNLVLIIGIVLLVSIIFFLSYILIKNAQNRKFLFQKEKELDQVIQLEKAAIRPKPPIDNDQDEVQEEIEKDDQKLFQELLQEIQHKKLYLDPKLNQQSLVNEFGTNRQYLYEAISKNGEDNFRGLINRFRVNEAKEQMEAYLTKDEKMDFSILAEKVGFNSYATFYRAFKNCTGLTPVEFSKELLLDKRKNLN